MAIIYAKQRPNCCVVCVGLLTVGWVVPKAHFVAGCTIGYLFVCVGVTVGCCGAVSGGVVSVWRDRVAWSRPE